jgi:membrane protein involved in colicin uptake
MAKSSTGSKGIAAGASTNNTVSFKKSVVTNTASTRQQAGASPAPPRSADMDDIFGALSKKKKVSPTGPGASASQTGSVGSSNAGKIDAPQLYVKPKKGDGLYRTAAASVEMADDDFFGESASASTSKKAAKKSSSAATLASKPKRSLEKEGVDRVITEDELMKLTSAKDEAGTTPNCPFDCDCCF